MNAGIEARSERHTTTTAEQLRQRNQGTKSTAQRRGEGERLIKLVSYWRRQRAQGVPLLK